LGLRRLATKRGAKPPEGAKKKSKRTVRPRGAFKSRGQHVVGGAPNSAILYEVRKAKGQIRKPTKKAPLHQPCSSLILRVQGDESRPGGNQKEKKRVRKEKKSQNSGSHRRRCSGSLGRNLERGDEGPAGCHQCTSTWTSRNGGLVTSGGEFRGGGRGGLARKDSIGRGVPNRTSKGSQTAYKRDVRRIFRVEGESEKEMKLVQAHARVRSE